MKIDPLIGAILTLPGIAGSTISAIVTANGTSISRPFTVRFLCCIGGIWKNHTNGNHQCGENPFTHVLSLLGF